METIKSRSKLVYAQGKVVLKLYLFSQNLIF